MRVGLMPTPRSVRPSVRSEAPSTRKNAADEKSPGTSISRAAQSLPAFDGDAPVRAQHLHAECAQHALRVIARGRGLDHARAALGAQRGEQHRGLHLRARHRQLVVDGAQRCAARDLDRRQAVLRGDGRAHQPQRHGDALHRPLHQRRIADERRVERLRGQQSHEQTHRRAGVAHVQRRRRRLEALEPHAVNDDAVAAEAARCSRRACAAPRASRGNPRCRESRVTSVSPSAMPPSMSERCETDLSPGTLISPPMRLPG